MTEQITPTPQTGLGAPSVLVEPGTHSAAGRPATLRVHVRNLAATPRDVTITVMGLDDGWSPEPVRLAAVDADATVSAEAALVPATGAVPGDYPFVVVVQSTGPTLGAETSRGTRDGATTTLAEGVLTVDAPSEVLLTVEPADSRMRLRRRLSVVVSNTGVEPVDLSVATQTSRGLRLELPERTLTVPGRQTVRVPVTARNLRPQLMGHLDRRTFSVVAQGRQAPARFSGTVTARPLVGSGAVRALGLLMVVVLWGGGLLVALPWFTDRAGDQQTTAQPAPTVEATPGGDGTAPGTDADSGGPDGSGTPGEGDGSLPDAGVRVGGVVTADDPSGVRVQIVPASIIPPATQQGQTGSGAGASGGGGGVVLPASAPGTSATSDAAPPSGGSARPITKTAALGLPLGTTSSAGQGSTVGTARTTETGADGAWAFAGLAPTLNYLVTVSKPGYQTVRHVVSGAEAASAALDVTLVAGDGSLSGVVTGPDGAGAGGVEVVLSDGTTTVTTTTATSGAVGSWAVDGLSTPSTYLVTAQGAGLGAQSTLVPLAAGGSTTAPITLREGVATLSGTVTGPDALGFVSSVGGATVTATGAGTERTASTLTTGRPGAFSLVDLPVPGSYTLTVEATGFATQTLELDLGPESSATPADVLLGSSSGVAQGTVRDTAGKALAGAGLSLSNGTDSYKTMSTSDGSGSFRFNGIVPGEYVLSAELFGHLTASTTVTVASGGTVGADLVLTAVDGDGLVDTSRVRGRASDARTNGQIGCAGLPTGEECLVTVSLTAQNPDGTQRTVSVTSEPDLEYLVPAADDAGLLPGLYELTVSAPGYESSTVKVNVPMAQTVSAGQVALVPSPSLTGTVLARVGSVPDGTCVVAVASGRPAPTAGCAAPTPGTCEIAGGRCAYTGVNGGYTISSVPAGTYTVTVLPGSAEYRVSGDASEVTLVAGDVRRVDATLDRLARLSVTTLVDRGTGAVTSASGASVVPVRLTSPEQPGTPVVAGPDGVASLDMLEPGKYRLDVVWDDQNVQLTGKVEGLELALNQERATQLVLTRGARVFSGQLVTQLRAGIQREVKDHEVQLTGIIGYNGVTPVRDTVTVTTDERGVFRTSTDPGAGAAGGYLPLVSDKVDLTVAEAKGYKVLSLTGLSFDANATTVVELQPLGQPFGGTLTLVGDGDRARDLASKVLFEVVSGPPGAGPGAVSIAPDVTGDGPSWPLLWRDVNQPGDGDTGGTLARPGSYVIRASLAGHETVEELVTVEVGTGVDDVDFELVRFGNLKIRPVTCPVPAAPGAGCTVPVSGAEVTVSGNGVQQTAVVPEGTGEVEFGEVPSGEYRVVVRAAGFERLDARATVTAGSDTPTVLTVVRLGSISGTVRSTTARPGEPPEVPQITRRLPGVVVTATGPSNEKFSAVSGPDGAYTITGTAVSDGLKPGDWKVSAVLEGYESASELPVAVGSEPATMNIDMSFTLVNFTVLVVNDLDDGMPVDGLTVRLQDGVRSHEPQCYVGKDDCEKPLSGQYTFTNVLPTQSILSISGSGFRPLQVSVTPPVGQQNSTITVPLVASSNAIGGVVSTQRGAERPVPLGGVTVELSGGGLESPRTQITGEATTEDPKVKTGEYLFADLADGAYLLTAAVPGYGTVERTVTVAGGQAALVELTLFQETRPVVVTASSGNGSDLAGTLVSLSTSTPGAVPSSMSAQPLVRSAGGTFTTTFNQVPVGEWTATFTGTAGHVWTTTAEVPTDGLLPVTIDEVRLRLVATGASGGSGLPVTITGGPPGGATSTLTRTLPVGAPAETVYLLAGSYTITPGTLAGATVSPGSLEVVESDSDRLASFSVLSTSSTAVPEQEPWTIGTTRQVVVTVTGPPGTAPTGSAELFLGSESLGVVDLDGAGRATFSASLPGSAVAGTAQLRAVYSGSTSVAGSEGTTAVAVVAAPTTTVLTSVPASLTVGDEAAVDVSVTAAGGLPVTGVVQLYLDEVAVGTETNLGTGGSARVVFSPASAHAGATVLTARFTGTASLAPSQSTGSPVVVAPGATRIELTQSAAGQPVVAAVTRVDGTSADGVDGVVAFDGLGSSCAAVPVTAAGTAACSVDSLSSTPRAVTAHYSGSAAWAGSSSTVLVVSGSSTGP